MPLTHAHPGSGSPSSPPPPPPSFPAADHTAAIAAAAAATTTTTTTSPPSPPVPPPSSSPPPAPSSPSPSPLESLPTELLTRIATTLPTLRDLKSLRLTSRRLADGTSYAYGVRGLSRVQFFFFRRSLRRLAELSRSEKWSKHVREVRIAKSFVPWRKKHQAPSGREWERQREVQVHMMVHRGGLGAAGEEGREDAVVGVGEDGFGVLGGVRVVMVEIRTGRAEDAQHHRCLPHLFAHCPRLDTIHYDSLYIDQHKPMSAYIWVPPPPPPSPSSSPSSSSSFPASLRRLRFTRSHFWHATALADFVRAYASVLTAVEVSDMCATHDWSVFLLVLRDECPLLEEVVFEGNVCRFREVEVVWGDGVVDRGENVGRVVGEKGVRGALGEMVGGLRLGRDVM